MPTNLLPLIVPGVAAAVLLPWRFAKRRTTFGSAGWLPAWTASGKGLFRPDGVIAGDWSGLLPVHYGGGGHALTVAPTGAGKGTCAIIPNLLRHPWVFVIDPGGENTAIAAKAWRRKGYHFICLNPWGMHTEAPWSLPSHAVNPLSILDPASEAFASDADLIADMIVPLTGKESGSAPFFKQEARSGIRAFLMHIVTTEPPARRNLLTLRKYICAEAPAWGALMAAMKLNKAGGGLIAREAAQFERREGQSPEEFSGVVSTIKQDTNFLEDPVMQRALSGESADLSVLKGRKDGKRIKGCAVSVVMPLPYLDTHAAYSRLIAGMALWTMQRGALSRGRVLFVLDEFPALKRLDRIANGLATLRKYRVWLWPIIQNIGQLKSIYGANWQTFMSNAGLKQFIGTGDLETAEYVSALCGETTIEIKTRHSGGNITRAETQRKLATVEEVMTLRGDRQIVFVDANKPLLLRKTPYWERIGLRGLFHPNPYRPGTPALPLWTAPAAIWGAGLRFAAWLVRPAAPVVAAAVMASVFAADPGVLITRGWSTQGRLTCFYRTFTGYAQAPYGRDGCSLIYFRPMSDGSMPWPI
jgi:type IV secretion system protein VirD4